MVLEKKEEEKEEEEEAKREKERDPRRPPPCRPNCTHNYMVITAALLQPWLHDNKTDEGPWKGQCRGALTLTCSNMYSV